MRILSIFTFLLSMVLPMYFSIAMLASGFYTTFQMPVQAIVVGYLVSTPSLYLVWRGVTEFFGK